MEHLANKYMVNKLSPWQTRFHTPDILWTQIAPMAPNRGLIASNKSGSYQLYAWDLSTNTLRLLTKDRPNGTMMGTLSPDGCHIYYLNDLSGNELGHWVRISWEGDTIEDLSPNEPLYSSSDIAISANGTKIGFNQVDSSGFLTRIQDISLTGHIGPLQTIHKTSRIVRGPVLSANGEIAVIASPLHSELLDYALVAIDLRNSAFNSKELWHGKGTSLWPVVFSPIAGDLRVLATLNTGENDCPIIWNIINDECTKLSLDGLSGDIVPWGWAFNGRHILLCHVYQATQRLIRYDLINQSWSWLNTPKGTYFSYGGRGTYYVPGGEIIAHVQSSAQPPQVVALDGETGELLRIVLGVKCISRNHEWSSFKYSSRDTISVQGWLATPPEPGPFPLILHVHGGPQSVMMDIFLPSSQAWVDHGFAWCSVNYRGSTTFGRFFESQIWGNLGYWEVEDIVAARDWLVNQGIACHDAIFLTGYSYGGYLTLYALGKYPDLWAGGIAQVAVADFIKMYEDSSASLRGYLRGLFGGTPLEKPEQYATSSPKNYAAQVKAPILIFQGKNDTRCPARQMEDYVSLMHGYGKEIDIVWYDSGHSSPAIDQQIRQQELMIQFAQNIKNTLPK